MPFDGAGYGGEARALGKIDEVIDLLNDGKGWCKLQLHSGDGRHCICGATVISPGCGFAASSRWQFCRHRSRFGGARHLKIPP